MVIVGIDIGTAAIKVAFTDGQQYLWTKARDTVPHAEEVCQALLEEGLKALTMTADDVDGIATTGYGKRLFSRSCKFVNEISANAMGAFILSQGTAGTVVNIGGQDAKVIKISSQGKADDFKMNTKCAAGTGRFFEMAARILNASLDDFERLSRLSRSPVSINSTCVVFAESEIVSLLSTGRDRNDIIAGLHKSVARKISEMSESIPLEDVVYLDGGPAKNKGLLSAIQSELMREVAVLSHPQFTAAFGAARILFNERKISGNNHFTLKT